MIKYFDKYRYMFIKTDSIEESKILHQLFFDNDITWNGEKVVFSRATIGYFIIGYYNPVKNKEKLIGFIEEIKPIYEEHYFNLSNKKIYNINDYKSIECLIKYGYDIPNYKPKKIERKI
jgi:hypothetical protein